MEGGEREGREEEGKEELETKDKIGEGEARQYTHTVMSIPTNSCYTHQTSDILLGVHGKKELRFLAPKHAE